VKLLSPVPPEVAAKAEARVRTPEDEKVEVEVLPKMAEPVTVRELARTPAEKFCRAVQVLATDKDAPLPLPVAQDRIPEPSVTKD